MGINNANRASILALRASGLTTAQVEELTGFAQRTIRHIYNRAISRGFDPAARPFLILDEHVADAKRTGRPRKRTAGAGPALPEDADEAAEADDAEGVNSGAGGQIQRSSGEPQLTNGRQGVTHGNDDSAAR